jgi:hypothetical protein
MEAVAADQAKIIIWEPFIQGLVALVVVAQDLPTKTAQQLAKVATVLPTQVAVAELKLTL